MIILTPNTFERVEILGNIKLCENLGGLEILRLSM